MDKSYSILEFSRVCAMLREECCSYMGQEIAEALTCEFDMLRAETLQEETAEAVEYLTRSGGVPIRAFDDIREQCARAGIGSILSPAELLKVCSALRCVRESRESILKGDTAPGEKLTALAQQLVSFTWFENEVQRSIENEDRVADGASAELSRIRRGMLQCQAKIKQKLEQIIRSGQYRDILQDAIITQRQGRYVVPVRAEYRSRLPGLIHDQSGSGATLFIEPMEAVEANNALRELQIREADEVQRILKALTDSLAPHKTEIYHALEAMARLDFCFAKARLAYRMDAVRPFFNKKGVVDIRNGRHPLIDERKVVPVSLSIGEGYTTLLITGPNTGGKTVTLKTVGLFALMAQAGLQLPASDGTTLPVFGAVYADIGDEQSIEQSLSTFSSHMRNIVDILSAADRDSLVLLDELGAGTDPHEGAALAIAIIERLKQRGCTTLATTHYSELKAYALKNSGVENASMEFDIETLRPTYHLTMGIPGKSNAFEIALRLGVDEKVIAYAREQMSREVASFEDVLQDAEYHKEVARREREQAEELNTQIQKLHRQADEERAALAKRQEEILEKARTQAQRIVEKAKNESDAVVRELKAMKTRPNTQSDIDRAAQGARDSLKKTGADTMPEYEQIPQGEAPQELKAGESVIICDTLMAASVLVPPDEKGNTVVQAGIMKLTTNVKNLRRAKGKADKEIARRSPHFNLGSVSSELDIRGMDSEQGIMETDRYLDEAFRSGLNEVSIIHGKGSGKLRSAIKDFLSHHPHVKAQRLGTFGEGESGVTIVSIK